MIEPLLVGAAIGIALFASIAALGMWDSASRYGPDYWKYGAMGCAEREYLKSIHGVEMEVE